MIQSHGIFSENVSYGFFDPMIVVINQLIDDGNQMRSNRKNILSGLYNKIGVSLSKSPSHEYIACITFSGEINKIQPILDNFK